MFSAKDKGSNEKKQEMIFENTSQCGSNELIFIRSVEITQPSSDCYTENVPHKDGSFPLFSFEYVYSGCGHIEIGSDKHTVCSGDGMILCSNQPYKCYSEQKDPLMSIRICVGGKATSTLVNIYFPEAGSVIAHGISPEPFERIKDSVLSPCPSDIDISASIYEIILSIYNKSRVVSPAAKHADRAKIIIDRDWGYRLTVDDIGRIMKLSPTYVSELFKSNYGMPLKAYILKRKITAAKKLLKANQASMSEIAEILNFSSIYHFSTAFKNTEGISPTDYKASLSKNKH